MNFYNLIQQDPRVLKSLIKKSDNKQEKSKLRLAMVTRSLLIVLFAIAFIAPLSSIFGNANSCVAVVIFCILLSVRFVDFGYCIKDSLINLSLIFFILLVSPVLTTLVHPIVSFLIHFVSFFAILVITCDKVEMGNAGLYSFAYIFLSGNPVYGYEFIQRLILVFLGFLICAVVFYLKHHDKNKNITFISKLKEFKLENHKETSELKMALGLSLILTIGYHLKIERFMWAGFACGSLLSDFSVDYDIKKRFLERFIGVIMGSLAFYGIYHIIPPSLHFIIGPLGGFCLGFSTDYKYKTAINCFGALMLAAGIYGINTAVLLRIQDTVIGILFSIVFYYFFELNHKLFIKKKKTI